MPCDGKLSNFTALPVESSRGIGWPGKQMAGYRQALVDKRRRPIEIRGLLSIRHFSVYGDRLALCLLGPFSTRHRDSATGGCGGCRSRQRGGSTAPPRWR